MAIREIITEVEDEELVGLLVASGHLPDSCEGWTLARVECINDGSTDFEVHPPEPETPREPA